MNYNDHILKLSKRNLKRHQRNYYIIKYLPSSILDYLQIRNLFEFYGEHCQCDYRDEYHERYCLTTQLEHCINKINSWQENIREYS